MISLSGARERLLSRKPPISSVRMTLEDALDRVLAAPLSARCSAPGAPTALLHGWAVKAAETIGSSPYSPCFPSQTPKAVVLGEALPLGCDAVSPTQAVAVAPGLVEILAPARPGEGLRATGRDFAGGEVLAECGDMLRATDLALLRLARVESVEVFVPRLHVLAREGSANWLVELSRREGVDCVVQASSSLEEAAQLVSLSNADVAIVVDGGGALESAGEGESEVLFREVAVRPGRFTTATLLPRRAKAGVESDDRLLTFFVPDRMENLLAAWLLLVRPMLRAAVGARRREPQTILPIGRKIVSDPGWSEMVLLRRSVEPDDQSPRWEPLATGDVPYHAIARADAWTLVESASEGWAVGEPIAAEPL